MCVGKLYRMLQTKHLIKMAVDICFDVKTFLERTCRTCSRYFNEEIMFYKIFQEKFFKKDAFSELMNQDDVLYDVNNDVKDIFKDFNIWQLNIKPADGLPQQICVECYERFKQVYLFREECLDSQKVLQSYLIDVEHLLESSQRSPKTESVEFVKAVKPAMGQKSPLQLSNNNDVFSPFSSPRLRLSPKFGETLAYFDSNSSMGTPPPLFEEIETDAIDMQTMETIKPECELRLDNTLEDDIHQKPNDESHLEREWDSSDNELSAGNTDDEADDSENSLSSNDESPYQDYTICKKRSYLQCKICGLSCGNRQLLKTHNVRHHPQEKPFTCSICSKAFKTTFLLAQHKLQHNRPDTMQCQDCGKYFRSQLHLQRHFKNFHLTSTYTCHICNQQFENYTQMRFQYHIRQHGEKRFNCTHCSKAFHQKIHLINHERTHTKEQPFQCDYCGKAYRLQSDCHEHMKTHHDPNPFKCKLCGKACSQRSVLRWHMRKVHNIKRNASLAVTRSLKRMQSSF